MIESEAEGQRATAADPIQAVTFPSIATGAMPADIEPVIRDLAEVIIAVGGSNRAANVPRVIFDKG